MNILSRLSITFACFTEIVNAPVHATPVVTAEAIKNVLELFLLSKLDLLLDEQLNFTCFKITRKRGKIYITLMKNRIYICGNFHFSTAVKVRSKSEKLICLDIGSCTRFVKVFLIAGNHANYFMQIN